MSRFTVFDVETPNRMSNRMSAIGITVIEGGTIALISFLAVHSDIPPSMTRNSLSVTTSGNDLNFFS